MFITILIVLLLFICVAALVLALTTSTRQLRIEERVERVQAERPQMEAPASSVSRQLQQPFYERIIKPVFQKLNQALLSIAPQGMIERVQKQLAAAGNPPSLSPPVFLLLRGFSMLAGAGLSAYAYFNFLASAAPLMRIVGSLLVLVIISFLPDYLLSSRTKARQTAIRKALPDVLDLLVVSVEAGMGLDGALAEVVKRKHGPLADEFERALVEIRLGKRRRDAWMDMAERAQVEELTALVAALYQADQLGVSIAKVLRAHSDALRTKRSMKIREIAATLGTKMLFPLIFCIFPALFVIIIGPGLMNMKSIFAVFGK